MPDSDGPRGPLEALRNAARGGQERFFVALSDRLERSRIAGALTSEGFVLEAESLSDALSGWPTNRSTWRSWISPPSGWTVEPGDGRDPLAASRELRPFSDLVLISDGDPARGGSGLRARGGRRLAAAAAGGRRAACARTSSGWPGSGAPARAASWS